MEIKHTAVIGFAILVVCRRIASLLRVLQAQRRRHTFRLQNPYFIWKMSLVG